MERGEVDVANEFNVYTREAGSGGLAISVEGPSKAEIKFEDKRDGSSVVSYKCSDPGKFLQIYTDAYVHLHLRTSTPIYRIIPCTI